MNPDLPKATPQKVLSVHGCQPRRVHSPFDLTVYAAQGVCLLGDEQSGAREAWRVLAEQDLPLRGDLNRSRSIPAAAGGVGLAGLSVLERDPRLPWWNRKRLEAALNAVAERSVPDPQGATAAMVQAFALEDACHKRLGELTPGERRRYRFARAFLMRPALLMTLNPTAHLDVTSAQMVLDGLTRARRQQGVALVWTSSDPQAAARHADQVLVFHCGRVVRQGPGREVLPPPGASVVEMEVWGDIAPLVRRLEREPWVVRLRVLTPPGITRLVLVVTDPQRALYLLPRLAVAVDVTPHSCRSSPLTLDALLRETHTPGAGQQ